MVAATSPLKSWAVTPWAVNPDGSWKQQPVVLVEGESPWFSDTPNAYIKKLQEMLKRPDLLWGSWHRTIGEFLDEAARPKT